MGVENLQIPLEWGNLAALAQGPVDGPGVFLLHGWLDNAASFETLAPHLPKSLRLVSLELAGHGHSDHRPKGVAYHLIDAVEDVLRAADFLKWETFSLVGHSLGGGIASFVAGVAPQRVKKLVLLEALGPLSASAEKSPQHFAEYYTAITELGKKKLPVYASMDLAVRARLQVGGLSADGARRLVQRGIKKVEGGFTWRSDPRLRTPSISRMTENQTLAFLRQIACAPCAIFTEEGIVLGRPGLEERIAAVSGLQVQTIKGGHHIHMDAPAQMIEWIASALL